MENITALLDELRAKAKALWGMDIPYSVEFNNRLTSTAGRAFYESGRIELSRKLYEANVQGFFADTIPHEYSHIVAWVVYGERGHGAMWKLVMYKLGYVPQRCHSYEVHSRAKNTTKHKCSCREWDFTPQRMAWVNKGRVYSCPHCGSVITKV
jgi:SprT protein